MNQEESLAFLQSCIKKVEKATKQDIELYKKNYALYCSPSKEECKSEFEFILPTNELQHNYKIRDEFTVKVCDLIIKETTKKQLEYGFINDNLLSKKDDDNFAYAA